MKAARIFLVLLLCSGGLFLLSTCKKGIDGNKITPIVKNKLSGYVQKGPFINGTSIQMYELDAQLGQTGKNFTTQIINNKGSFEIDNITLSSQYVEFIANGYYYNEFTGAISVSPLNLYALSDITDLTSVNVNILTHLEKDRVEYLVGDGINFPVAKDSAQAEILAIFGYKGNTMDQSEKLDISVNKDENAVLLAISLILQGERSVGDLTELIANISTDIKQDGILNSNSILDSLRNSTLKLDLSSIRSNLVKRYRTLGDSVAIPDFEKYISIFLGSTGGKPVVTTQKASNLTTTTATINGTVNPNSLSTDVTFEYGTTTSYGNTITATQSSITGYTNINVCASITGLTPDTTYHFRVKAVNSLGTTYGSDLTFTYYTVNYIDSVVDVDGNVYKAVLIGSQIWMEENLKTTKYRDGSDIPNVLDNTSWAGLSNGAYSWYNNDISNKTPYGAYYNFYAVADSRNLCPLGWHVPTSMEWETLYTFLGGHDVAGGKLKETSTTHWNSPNTGATNETGFTGLPGGARQEYGTFNFMGVYGYYWTSSEFSTLNGYLEGSAFNTSGIGPGNLLKTAGFSIRCIKDN